MSPATNFRTAAERAAMERLRLQRSRCSAANRHETKSAAEAFDAHTAERKGPATSETETYRFREVHRVPNVATADTT